VTLRVYSHLMEGALANAAARYDPLGLTNGDRAAAAEGISGAFSGLP